MPVSKMYGPNGPRVIIHTPEPSHGMAFYVSELAVALARLRTPVLLFCPENFEHQEKVRDAGADIVHAAHRDVSLAGFTERVLRNFKFLVRSALAQFRLTRHEDIVHFQDVFHLPFGLLFFLIAKANGASTVFTAHDPLPHRWRLPGRLRWIERKMLQLSYHLSDRLIVHNQQGKDVLIRQFHQQARRICVIPHGPYSGVNSSEFPPFDCLRLLAFGAIRQNKGLDLAIEAVQKAAASSPIPVHLTIAGRVQNASEQKYWDRCKELIRVRPDGIDVLDRLIEEEEIGPLMARHHAVLLPYTGFYSESGVAALALSHHRPILATPSGGLRELLERGDCGLAIPSLSSDAVAQVILKAIELGRERLRQWGLNGSQFIIRERSWDSIARQTVKVYSELSEEIAASHFDANTESEEQAQLIN